MSVFTTWTDLYNEMLDKITSGNTTVGSVTSASGKTITYKSNKEFLEMLEFVKQMANQETGASVTRTFAKQGGRG